MPSRYLSEALGKTAAKNHEAPQHDHEGEERQDEEDPFLD